MHYTEFLQFVIQLPNIVVINRNNYITQFINLIVSFLNEGFFLPLSLHLCRITRQ